MVEQPQIYHAPTTLVHHQAPAAIVHHAAPVAVAHAAPLAVAHAAPLAVAHAAVAHNVEEYDPHPQYSYAYDIQDGITGDSKNQHETRDGDVVQGQYSLTDADGLRRTVDYTADPINGFNAVVHREPIGVKAIVAQPILKAAPLAYAAAPAAVVQHHY